MKWYKLVILLVFLYQAAFAQSDIERLYNFTDSISLKNPKEAIKIADSILEKRPDAFNTGRFYILKGKGEYISGEYQKAGKSFTSAREALESIPVTIELAVLYNEQAKLHRKLGMYNEAIELYGKARSTSETLKDTTMISNIYNEWGAVYEMMGENGKAISFYQKALSLKQKMKDYIGLAYSYSFLSNIYLGMGEVNTAEDYALKSMDLFQYIQAPLNKAQLSLNTAMVYDRKSDFSTAIHYLKISEKICVELGYKDMLAATYKYIAENYAHLNDYQTAYDYYQKHSELRDSIFTANAQKAIAELNVQYQTAEKDNSILLQKNELSRQRSLLIFAFLTLAGAIAMTISVYRNKRLKEAQLLKESEHKEEILRLEAAQNLQKDRLRISRDLHDNIGSYLTYINSTIDHISKEQNTENQDIHTLKNITSETIAELRRTVWLINKPSVTMEEWVIKLKDHYIKTPLIKIEADLENGELQLTAIQATTLFRIIQEATNNSLKYAEADRILVHISQKGNTISISVTDNGNGFDTQNIRQGFGLSNMVQRAKELQGSCTISSIPGKGTEIVVLIPVGEVMG